MTNKTKKRKIYVNNRHTRFANYLYIGGSKLAILYFVIRPVRAFKESPTDKIFWWEL